MMAVVIGFAIAFVCYTVGHARGARDALNAKHRNKTLQGPRSTTPDDAR